MDKRKIMVIDDEHAYLELVKLNLEATGKYEVLTLSSARDIIRHLHSYKPDIILLDILMPAVDGIEACDLLNRDSLGKKIPIIIVSALDTDKDKLDAYKAGVVDYLTKPVDKDVLIAKIEKALEYK